MARDIRAHRLDVEATTPDVAAGGVADGDDLAAHLGQQLGRDPADVPEALDDDAEAFEVGAGPARPLAHHQADAAAGRLVAPERAADQDRLAGDHGIDGVTLVHRDRVHDPGHDLRVGVHIRRGDISIGADQNADLGREAASEALQLIH